MARAAGNFYNLSFFLYDFLTVQPAQREFFIIYMRCCDFFVHSLFQNLPMIEFQIGNDVLFCTLNVHLNEHLMNFNVHIKVSFDFEFINPLISIGFPFSFSEISLNFHAIS